VLPVFFVLSADSPALKLFQQTRNNIIRTRFSVTCRRISNTWGVGKWTLWALNGT